MNRPLRIAIATPNREAYSETFIAAHIKRLEDVVLTLTDGALPCSLGDGTPILLGTPGYRWRNRWESWALRLDVKERVRRRITMLLRQHRVDVVLAEYGHTGEELLASCRQAHVPLVVHFHGYDAHTDRMLLKHGNYARIFGGAAALVVVSRSMEAQLLKLGAPREKVIYNCYGVDVESFANAAPAHSAPQFLAVGRFVEKKAPLLTLLAFREVVQQRSDARLIMAGSGHQWEAAAQVVRGLGLTGLVDLCGVKEPAEVAALMQQSRAFVQHSVVSMSGDCEGTPLAVLEAMASGIPVVATRHAGIADVVAHGERGLLCDEFDVHAMAANMLRLASDPALAGRMGAAARAYMLAHHRVQDSVRALQGVLSAIAFGPMPR